MLSGQLREGVGLTDHAAPPQTHRDDVNRLLQKRPGMATKKKETFELNEPNASVVELLGGFTNWEENPIPLRRQKNGVWRATVTLEPGAHEYRFRVDGQWRDDLGNVGRCPNPFGGENCIRDVGP
jgi:1,4-alpha-glucan branching enzyme